MADSNRTRGISEEVPNVDQAVSDKKAKSQALDDAMLLKNVSNLQPYRRDLMKNEQLAN